MKVSVQDGKGCEKVLKVEVSQEEIQKEYQEFYQAVAPKAKVPGFRPGKAPRHVLEMYYGSEAKNSVLKELVSHSYSKALNEKSLSPLGMPEIEDVDFKDTSLSYKARIEVRPKIKLNRVTGLKAKKTPVEVAPTELEEALTRVRESFAQFKVVEGRSAKIGDYLIVDYECSFNGHSIEKRAEEWIELREKEFLEGFSTQLVGVAAGETKEFSLKLPDNFTRKEYAGKDAQFKVAVKEIKQKELPPLDDELAKDAGEFKSLDELKEKIKKDLRAHKEQEVESKFEKELLDELIKQNKMDLPERFVEYRLEHMVKDALKHYQEHGSTEDRLKEMTAKLNQDLAPEARRQVHVAFLLDELATRENLLATEEDLKAKYQLIATQVRQPVDVIEKYYQADEHRRDSLSEQIRSEKAVEFLKKNSKEK